MRMIPQNGKRHHRYLARQTLYKVSRAKSVFLRSRIHFKTEK